MTNGEVEQGGTRRKKKKEDANQMPTAAATSKAGSVRLCHQLSGSAPASPLFECAIVGICDDDERAFLESSETDEAAYDENCLWKPDGKCRPCRLSTFANHYS